MSIHKIHKYSEDYYYKHHWAATALVLYRIRLIIITRTQKYIYDKDSIYKRL